VRLLYSKGRRFDSHRDHRAYLSSLPRHIFQACPVWIYTQSNITSILFTWVHYTNTVNISFSITVKSGFPLRATLQYCHAILQYWSADCSNKLHRREQIAMFTYSNTY
jgi:hypothetical protein